MSAVIDGNSSPLQTPHSTVPSHKPPASQATGLMFPQKEPPKTPFGSHGSTSFKSLQIKGRPGSLELMIDADAPLMHILEELRQLLLANSTLLKHASTLTLNFNSREIDRLQYAEIHKIVESHGLTVGGLTLQPEALESYLEGEFGVPVVIQTPSPKTAPEQEPAPTPNTGSHQSPIDMLRKEAAQKTMAAKPAMPAKPAAAPVTRRINASPTAHAPQARGLTGSRSKHESANPPLNPITPQTHASPMVKPSPSTQPASQPTPSTPQQAAPASKEAAPHRELHKVMRTLRAGNALDFEGDVVVFGDLNAGAEIKATGDIIVLGSLRGVAHAGFKGDTSARIFANDLSPTQLRLAHQIAIAPPNEKSRQRTRMSLEMAFLNNGKQIEVKSVDAGRIPI